MCKHTHTYREKRTRGKQNNKDEQEEETMEQEHSSRIVERLERKHAHKVIAGPRTCKESSSWKKSGYFHIIQNM